MNQYTVEQFRNDLQNPYAWPGGYPRYFVMDDGEALSFNAAIENQELIESSIKENSNDGWRIIACEINWEDESLYCDHTGEKIQSAYGGD